MCGSVHRPWCPWRRGREIGGRGEGGTESSARGSEEEAPAARGAEEDSLWAEEEDELDEMRGEERKIRESRRHGSAGWRRVRWGRRGGNIWVK